MASEFFINSQELEDKIRQLLPSQGGAGSGFDLSASTQIIPIIDLTESAEGSNLRQDLQTSLSFDSVTSFDVANSTATLINNTGYYRVFGVAYLHEINGAAASAKFTLNDGTSDKIIWELQTYSRSTQNALNATFDFNVFLAAGDILTSTATAQANIIGCTRQIADIDGVLVNPN
jgi:hypothetical protein